MKIKEALLDTAYELERLSLRASINRTGSGAVLVAGVRRLRNIEAQLGADGDREYRYAIPDLSGNELHFKGYRMIRYVHIGDQIEDDENQFAFFSTSLDTFLDFEGGQVFDSIDDFTSAAQESDIYARCLSLIPEDYPHD